MKKMLSNYFLSKRFLLNLFVIGWVFSTHTAAAQSTNNEIDTLRVSFTFKNTSLREALNQIVARTNIQVTYKDEIVKGIVINHSFQDITLHSLLDSIITGNGLSYKILSDDQIIIIKEKALKSNVIKGYIRDAYSGESLPYANIMLRNTKYGAASNVNGYFVMLNVPSGKCTLDVHYIGYKDYFIELNENNRLEMIDIALQQKALSGEEVTITSQNLHPLNCPQ